VGDIDRPKIDLEFMRVARRGKRATILSQDDPAIVEDALNDNHGFSVEVMR